MEDTCRACLKTGHSQRWFSLYEEPLKSMFYECTFVKVSSLSIRLFDDLLIL